MQNLVIPQVKPLEYCGQKVLSTTQIAVIFKCKRNNITDNFRNNKANFTENVDYFHLIGEELNVIKQADSSAQNNLCAFSKYSTNTYLWTQSGVEKLAKSIGTNEAKLICSALKFGYFQKTEQTYLPLQNSAPSNKFEVVDRLIKIAELTANKNFKETLLKRAAELI